MFNSYQFYKKYLKKQKMNMQNINKLDFLI